MKKKLIGTLCALAITVSSITPAVHAQVKTPDSLKEWNVKELTATSGNYTFTYYKSTDEKSSWLTKIDVTSNKGKVKNLDIPATLGGAPVTQIGYDYITRDANSGDDFDEFGQTVFGIYVEEAHNCDGAFEDIHSITKLTIPDTVKTIGWDSFSGLNALKEVKLPNDLTELGNSAFYGCDQLKKVTIGASLTSLNTYAFDDCPKLKTVRVSKSNHVLYAKDNMLINKKKKSVIWIAPAKKKVVIPNGTKVIGDYCFYGSKAESLVIPKSVKKIGKKALEASDLEKIRLKKGNKVYAKDGSCIYKKKTKELVVVTASKGGQVVKISPKVKKITRNAMTAGDNFIVNDGSSLDYIVIPASTILCDSWYQFYKAGYITCDVVFRGKTLPKYSNGAQNIFPLFCTYYVPKGMVKKYKNWIKKTAPDYSSIIKVKTCTKKVKKSIK